MTTSTSQPIFCQDHRNRRRSCGRGKGSARRSIRPPTAYVLVRDDQSVTHPLSRQLSAAAAALRSGQADARRHQPCLRQHPPLHPGAPDGATQQPPLQATADVQGAPGVAGGPCRRGQVSSDGPPAALGVLVKRELSSRCCACSSGTAFSTCRPSTGSRSPIR